MNKSILKDSILGTVLIFLILFTLGEVFDSLEILDPIGEALEDVEMTDIFYSDENLGDNYGDDRVILVNIGVLSRAEIGMMVNIINEFNPKAIGMDTFFQFPKDSTGDAILADALSNVENLVMASQLLYNEETDSFTDLRLSHDKFNENAELAYVNLITGVGVRQEDAKTCRVFPPQENFGDSQKQAFAVKLAGFLAPDNVERFLKRGYEHEIINYRGNTLNLPYMDYRVTYMALDWPDVFDGNFAPEMIEDKIVIFGFLGNTMDDYSKNIEDKYFTPLNKKYAGRGNPDMYGAVIHANIISMILDEKYIGQLDDNIELIIAVILCFLNVWFCTWVNVRLPYWYDGITKTVVLAEIITIFGLIFYFFANFQFKIEITLAMICIALSSDVMEFYHGILKSLMSAKGRRQIFKVYKEGKLSELE